MVRVLVLWGEDQPPCWVAVGWVSPVVLRLKDGDRGQSPCLVPHSWFSSAKSEAQFWGKSTKLSLFYIPERLWEGFAE